MPLIKRFDLLSALTIHWDQRNNRNEMFRGKQSRQSMPIRQKKAQFSVAGTDAGWDLNLDWLFIIGRAMDSLEIAVLAEERWAWIYIFIFCVLVLVVVVSVAWWPAQWYGHHFLHAYAGLCYIFRYKRCSTAFEFAPKQPDKWWKVYYLYFIQNCSREHESHIQSSLTHGV